MTWYFLDPDNNKRIPDSLHCARCKKPISKFGSYTSIVLHRENPWFRIANGHEAIDKNLAALIGSDCLERVKKEFGEMNPHTVKN